jgi:eukaryotic-like serine/threonine-protein kinase
MLHLLRPIGEGGMGKVWVARHKGLETDVVVKFLSAMGADRPEAEARFAQEAASASAVKSPHVVQIFDHGTTAEGTRYIVMELLEGRDLATHLAQNGPMAPGDVAAVIAQVAKALARAHKAGIIHRDVKPENIFLCDADGGDLFVKVLDFGIAKREQQAVSKTSTGHVVGTPFYMSPEQILGERAVDARTDIWSMGCVAFEALTGKRPFDGATIGAITLAIHRSSPRPSALVPGLPPAIDEWFARACAREPEARFETAREAGQAILDAVGAVAGARMPAMSIVEGSELPFVPQPRAQTSLSSSFAVEKPAAPPRYLIAIAGVAVVGLVVALVLALRPAKPVVTTTSVASETVVLPPPSASSSAEVQAPAPPPESTIIELVPEASATPAATTAPRPKPRPTTTTQKPRTKPNDDDIK